MKVLSVDGFSISYCIFEQRIGFKMNRERNKSKLSVKNHRSAVVSWGGRRVLPPPRSACGTKLERDVSSHKCANPELLVKIYMHAHSMLYYIYVSYFFLPRCPTETVEAKHVSLDKQNVRAHVLKILQKNRNIFNIMSLSN